MKIKNPNFNICGVVLLVLFLSGCFNTKFKYQGAYPDRDYLNLYNFEEVGELRLVDEQMVSYRNRIYLSVDQALQVTLNGYPVNLENFAADFRYIYTNPDRLGHLPERPEKVVIFYATDLPANILKSASSNMEQERRLLEVNELQSTARKIVEQLKQSYFQEYFGMPLFGATDDQREEIEKMFPFHLAIYSSTFPENDNRGITAKLPPWITDEETLKERNVISVLVNKENKLLLRGKRFKVEKLTDTVKSMILNRSQNITCPENPRKAIVSLKNDRDTDYEVYLTVYNALKRAYDELWEEEAQSIFGKSYDNLKKEEIRMIKQKIPFVLSEAEPTAFGGE